jgi:hypothetical protein
MWPERQTGALADCDAVGHEDATGLALTLRERVFVDAIAARLAELLRAEPTCGVLVDAATLASKLGVSRDCVYAHADELGGERIGNGPRGRLRFDLGQALAAWTTRCHSKESHTPNPPAPTDDPARPRRQRMGSSPGLLPIRGTATTLDDSEERS